MESTTVMVKKNKKKSKDSLDSELADQYKMHEHGEHIYELPDTYIGSIEMTEEEQYVLDENERMVKEKIKFIFKE